MIGRRAMLAAIGMSPVAAAGAAAGGNAVSEVGVVSGAIGRAESPKEARMKNAFNAIRRDREARRNARTALVLPPHIDCKKSWSPAFKRLVYEHEMLEYARRFDTWLIEGNDDLLRHMARIIREAAE